MVGLILLIHGRHGANDMGVDLATRFFGRPRLPWPPPVVLVMSTLELLADVALILGPGTRVVALFLAADLLLGGLLVDPAPGRVRNPDDTELGVMLEAACLALVFTGPGALAVDNRLRRLRRTSNWTTSGDTSP